MTDEATQEATQDHTDGQSADTMQVLIDKVTRFTRFSPMVQPVMSPHGEELRALCFVTPDGHMMEFPMQLDMAARIGRELTGTNIQTAPAGSIEQLRQAGMLPNLGG